MGLGVEVLRRVTLIGCFKGQLSVQLKVSRFLFQALGFRVPLKGSIGVYIGWVSWDLGFSGLCRV